MVLVYGWGTKATPLGVTDIRSCDRCNSRGPWLVYQAKKQFKLYWIPVAQWNKKYVIECSVCPNAFEVSESEANRLLAEGEKGGEDRLIKALAAVLKATAKVGGLKSREWATAVAALVEMSDGRVSSDRANRLIQDARLTDVEPGLFDERERLVLLNAALAVAVADGVLDPPEIKALEQLATRLQIPLHVLNLLISRATSGTDPFEQGETGQSSSAYVASDRQRACEVLAVAVDASVAEIRFAYRNLVRQHHPDLAAPEDRQDATKRTALINAAYDYLLGKADKMPSTAARTAGGSARSDKKQRSSRPDSASPPRTGPTNPRRPTLCAACQRRVAADAKFCGHCGTASQR